jgi:hypothetical protein
MSNGKVVGLVWYPDGKDFARSGCAPKRSVRKTRIKMQSPDAF